jgi:hypothetical protein
MLPLHGELLENPDFEDEMEGWSTPRVGAEYPDQVNSMILKGRKGEPNVVEVEVPHQSQFNYMRLEQPIVIENGAVYRVSFEVRGEEPENEIRVLVSQTIGVTWKLNGLRLEIPVTPEWTRVVMRFRARDILPLDEEQKVRDVYLRFALGEAKGAIQLRRISMVKDEFPFPSGEKRGVLEDPEDPRFLPVDLKEPRTWTSTQGGTFYGVLTSHIGGMVVLREVPSGKILRVKEDQLSDVDRAILNQDEPR